MHQCHSDLHIHLLGQTRSSLHHWVLHTFLLDSSPTGEHVLRLVKFQQVLGSIPYVRKAQQDLFISSLWHLLGFLRGHQHLPSVLKISHRHCLLTAHLLSSLLLLFPECQLGVFRLFTLFFFFLKQRIRKEMPRSLQTPALSQSSLTLLKTAVAGSKFDPQLPRTGQATLGRPPHTSFRRNKSYGGMIMTP